MIYLDSVRNTVPFRISAQVLTLIQKRVMQLFLRVKELFFGKAVTPPTVSRERYGIPNSGNTCYMASVLQSLVTVKQVAATEWGKKPLPKTAEETETLLTHYYNNGWSEGKKLHEMRDARDFIEYLLPEIPVASQLYNIPVRMVTAGQSIQDLVKIKMNTDLLVVGVQGRAETNPPISTPIIPSQTVSQSGKLYDLRAVVVYTHTNQHYYSLVRENSEWVEYNDSLVSQHAQSEKIDSALQARGQLFFYEKR